jgi:peptide/nickel transport system substrate-binding protein
MSGIRTHRPLADLLQEHQTTRRKFVTTSALAGALAATGGAGLAFRSGASAASLAQAEPVRGGTLNVLVQNDWVSLDPLFNSAEPNGTNMIYGHWILWEPDPDTGVWGPQPDMVAAWELGENEIILQLQPGITFHDGAAWDAEVAKWNLDRMIFHPASTMKSYLAAVDTSNEDQAALDSLQDNASTFEYSSKAVEVVDGETVRIRLTQPLATILAALSDAVQWNNPVSPSAFNELGKDEFARNPVGSGPFRFVEWQSGNQVVVERSSDYWKTGADNEPLPYIDQIIYRLVIDDTVRLLELRSGAADFTELIQGKDVADVEADPSLILVQSESQGNNYRVIFDSTNAESVFQKHKKLRQAMLYAMDREAMAQVLGFGAGIGRKYLLPRGDFAYDESLPYYWFDQDVAKQLVQEAVDEDPSVADEEGKVAVTLTVIERALDKAQSEMIKQMADAVGFNVTIEILERAAWVAKLVSTPGQEGGKFEFATMRNPVAPADPDLQWRTFYHSSGGFNVAHLNDPALDELIDQAASTYDLDARIAAYHELQQTAYDDPWYGYLWQQNWNWAFRSRLQNFEEPVTNRWMFTETWIEEG